MFSIADWVELLVAVYVERKKHLRMKTVSGVPTIEARNVY